MARWLTLLLTVIIYHIYVAILKPVVGPYLLTHSVIDLIKNVSITAL